MKMHILETKLFASLKQRENPIQEEQEKMLQTEIAELKENLKRISEELEEKTFTVVEGIAYLIIGSQKQSPNYEKGFAAVIQDYKSLLNYVERVSETYTQQKNQLHAYFKQSPIKMSLKEKTLWDIEKKIQLFSDVFGCETVEKIWDSVIEKALEGEKDLKAIPRPLPGTDLLMQV